MSFFDAVIRCIARNHLASGVRDLWKIVPARADVCVRHARHWNNCRGSQKACSRTPHFGQRKPSGQRIGTSAARHCSSCRRAVELDRAQPLWNCTWLRATAASSSPRSQ